MLCRAGPRIPDRAHNAAVDWPMAPHGLAQNSFVPANETAWRLAGKAPLREPGAPPTRLFFRCGREPGLSRSGRFIKLSGVSLPPPRSRDFTSPALHRLPCGGSSTCCDDVEQKEDFHRPRVIGISNIASGCSICIRACMHAAIKISAPSRLQLLFPKSCIRRHAVQYILRTPYGTSLGRDGVRGCCFHISRWEDWHDIQRSSCGILSSL